jgi:ribosomal protein S14
VRTVVYPRRCDECGEPYEHVKGAPTGFCEPCRERLREYALVELPALMAGSYHLPFVQGFER